VQIPVPTRLDWTGRAIEPQGMYLPLQAGLPFYGREISVDGYVDETKDVKYMGVAVHVFDDVYRCIAIISGCMCVVEVKIRPHDHVLPSSTQTI